MSERSERLSDVSPHADPQRERREKHRLDEAGSPRPDGAFILPFWATDATFYPVFWRSKKGAAAMSVRV